MGKLILCSGARTARPYTFPVSGIRVYSMEELCYYLFHHVHLMEEDVIREELIDWIQTELKLPERAEKLRKLKEKKADIKTLVTVVLCSADYYTENEIKSLLKLLDETASLSRIKKSSLKAKHYLDKQQYREAAQEYEELLADEEAKEFTPEEYGDLLHNLAVARLHTIGFEAAAGLFEQAYVRNRREETLRQYLTVLRILGWEGQCGNMQEEYRDKLEEYQVEEELRGKVEAELVGWQEEAEACSAMEELRKLERLMRQGRMEEYYRRAEEMLEDWMGSLRQI